MQKNKAVGKKPTALAHQKRIVLKDSTVAIAGRIYPGHRG